MVIYIEASALQCRILCIPLFNRSRMQNSHLKTFGQSDIPIVDDLETVFVQAKHWLSSHHGSAHLQVLPMCMRQHFGKASGLMAIPSPWNPLLSIRYAEKPYLAMQLVMPTWRFPSLDPRSIDPPRSYVLIPLLNLSPLQIAIHLGQLTTAYDSLLFHL